VVPHLSPERLFAVVAALPDVAVLEPEVAVRPAAAAAPARVGYAVPSVVSAVAPGQPSHAAELAAVDTAAQASAVAVAAV